MIIYHGTKREFDYQVMNNEITDCILGAFKRNGLVDNNPKEINSWCNSLNFMRNVLDDPEIPGDATVAVEYKIPETAKRIDFMILGQDQTGRDNIIIIELKQWAMVRRAPEAKGHTIYCDLLGGSLAAHPSYKAYSYMRCIENTCEVVNQKHVALHPCAYCHNLSDEYRSIINDPMYSEWTSEAPAFLRKDMLQLRNFVKNHIYLKAKDGRLLYEIDEGKIKPQKALQDSLCSMLKGNEEFVLLDDQIVAFDICEGIIEKSFADGKKRTVIIEGGPGTGKSVLAVNLLVHVAKKYGRYAAYITKNSAPRNCYKALLAKNDPKKEIDITTLFPSPFILPECKPNQIDVGLFDEAHRLQTKPFMYKGADMLSDAIKASLVSIFFIDESQRICAQDIGSVNGIAEVAVSLGSKTYYGNDLRLRSEFRCNGSDSYIAFLDNLLMIRKTENASFEGDFDIEVFDDPCLMRDRLREKNAINNKARMVAGYCYDWNVKNGRGPIDISLPGGFQAQWNGVTDNIWAVNPDSFENVGCVHTAQGMEFDYVGVIIGKDLFFKDGRVRTNQKAISKDDHSSHIRSAKPELADRLIRNTYKVLLTRGQKGCYIYCEDKPLADYIRSHLPKIVK
jgi:DUF2075 family protein